MAEDMRITITDKELVWVKRRWLLQNEVCDNYARYMAMNFHNAMAPILRKLYTNDADLSEAMHRHQVFFNVEAVFGGLILGGVLAFEEEKANGADIPGEVIIGFKNGLMGPLSGIGDSLYHGTIGTMCAAFGISAAMAGNAAVAIFCDCIKPVVGEVMCTWFTRLAYKSGKESIAQLVMGGVMDDILDAAFVLGLMCMGVMCASFVKLNFAAEVTVGDSVFNAQAILDGIAPGLAPLGVVMLTYYGYIKSIVTPLKAMIIMLIVGVILAVLGIC